MADTKHDPSAPSPGHEQTDVSVRAVAKFGVYLTLAVIAVMGLLWLLFAWFERSERKASPSPAPMQAVDPRTAPPEPRLQSLETIDLRKFRADEDAILNSYGWVDPDKKVVRIPLDRAIELTAKEGLPSRSPR